MTSAMELPYQSSCRPATSRAERSRSRSSPPLPRGTLSGDGPTRFFIPDEGACGTDSFSYTVYDGTSTSEAATVRCGTRSNVATSTKTAVSTSQDFQGLQTCFTGRHGQGPAAASVSRLFRLGRRRPHRIPGLRSIRRVIRHHALKRLVPPQATEQITGRKTPRRNNRCAR